MDHEKNDSPSNWPQQDNSKPEEPKSSPQGFTMEPIATASFEPAPVAPTFDAPATSSVPTGVASQAVVNVLSPRGIEYVFLTIALFTAAIGLTSSLLALVNGHHDFDVLAFPVALMVVAVPIFAALFLRLKKAELQDSALKLDASKRRSTQFTQIASFVVCFFTLIGFVTAIFTKVSGDYNGSMVKLVLDVLVVLLVAGGILAYYWRDEHREG